MHLSVRLKSSLIGFLLLFTIFIFSSCQDNETGAGDDDDAGSDLPTSMPFKSGFSDDNQISIQDRYWPPYKRGPYAVGVTTIYLTDPDRWEMWGLRYRTLPLEIWYPSTGNGGTVNGLPDMIGALPDWGLPVLQAVYGDKFEELWSIQTSALRDAEWAPSNEPYPVLLFSHGLTAIRFQNYTMCEHLASHGFVVVAPDHYGNAVFVNLPEEAVIFFNPLTFVTSAFDRPSDVKFIYDELQNMTMEDQDFWQPRLDLSRFAVFGHSYGGFTCLEVGPWNDFVQAIAPINPAWIDWYPPNFSKPFFLLQSAHDSIVGITNPAVKDVFDQAASDDKLYINLLNGGHYNATDACTLLPPSLEMSPSTGCDGSQIDPARANMIVGSYLTAFFKTELVGDGRYDAYLHENHFPDDIDFFTTW